MLSSEKFLVVFVVLVISFKVNLGQNVCKTPGNKSGTCVPIAHCPYLNGLQSAVPAGSASAAEAFVKAHYCNETSGQSVIICCADGAVNQTEPKFEQTETDQNGNDETASRFQFPQFYNNPNSFQFPQFNFNGFQNGFQNPFGNFQPFGNFGFPGTNPGLAPAPPVQAPPPASIPPSSQNMRQIPSGGLNLLPSRVQCGTEIVGNRILNGEDAEENEFPWVALLEYRKFDGTFTIACAGSLINDQYVLSAGHCVTGKILKAIGPLVNVRLGDWDTTIENGGQRYNAVEEIIPHEDYVDGTLNHGHDIALIRLKRKVQYTTNVRPICLPEPSSTLRNGEQLYAAGFGRTLEAAKSAIKQKIVLPVFDQARCRSKFSDKRVEITNGHLCAGGEVNRDTCDGDSGGPLMKFKSNWILEGITSFGDSRCGRHDLPGVYTRVSAYLPWIRNNMRP